MFRRILLPVDLGGGNTRAVEVAKEYQSQSGSDVTLLHVIETVDNIPFEEMKDFYSRIEREAEVKMEKLAAALGRDAGEVGEAIVYGHRVQAIVDYAAQHDMDLIIMASRQFDPSSPARGWATISHRVAILSSCPVLLVK
jgi:nucleotide-binding universal stress UspA family protein